MEHDGKTYIYLVGQRKAPWWDKNDIEGWYCEAYERFNYVECAVYSKPTNDLTERDQTLVRSYGEPRESWECPGDWDDPSATKAPESPSQLDERGVELAVLRRYADAAETHIVNLERALRECFEIVAKQGSHMGWRNHDSLLKKVEALLAHKIDRQ